MNTIFCNIGWTKYYCGANYLDEYEHPKNGGSYNEDNDGLEFNNFKAVNGTCYGYVQPPAGGAMLHNDSHFGIKLNKQGFVDHVRVVWIANSKGTGFGEGTRIVGWYNDAKVFNKYQEIEINGTTGFYFSAEAENCVLLSEQERIFEFSKTIRNTWYVTESKTLSDKDQKLFSECEAFFEDYAGFLDIGSLQKTNLQTERTYTEGMTKHVTYEQRVRNSVVVVRAKEEFARANQNKLFCEVCGFDYQNMYGLLGRGFIEAHHIKPFSEFRIRSVRTNDFAMVCANCHRMLHRNGNVGVDELKKIINAN